MITKLKALRDKVKLGITNMEEEDESFNNGCRVVAEEVIEELDKMLDIKTLEDLDWELIKKGETYVTYGKGEEIIYIHFLYKCYYKYKIYYVDTKHPLSIGFEETLAIMLKMEELKNEM